MTRGLLFVLALVEAAIGLFGLLGAGFLFFLHSAGMTMLFLPVLAAFALLLVAGATIFVRRPWGYYVHIAVILLVGVLLVLYLGQLVGGDAWGMLLVIGTVTAALTVVFLLAPVRRYFGVSAGSA